MYDRKQKLHVLGFPPAAAAPVVVVRQHFERIHNIITWKIYD
jgi:uncharacterized membrane protein YesL